jgi:predicted RNA binding protein YcfA (HicA-like mRNA interferase family)
LGKLRVLSGKQVCAILAEHGFVQVRQRGSHVIMQKRVAGSTITVPVPNHRELASGTMSSIVRQSQLLRSVFES